MKVLGAVVTAILVVLYPVAIWIGLTHLSARAVSLFVVAAVVPTLVLRFRRASKADLFAALRVPLAILSVVALGVIFDDRRFVLAMPVLINASLLVTFAASLFGETTIVERFARMHEARARGEAAAELSPGQIAHCRQVTWAWCVFFLANGAVAAALALAAPLATWAAYTGGVAYALMGLMFAAERVVRAHRFRRYGSGLHERLLARIFPPRGP